MRSASCRSCPGRRNSGADASSLSYLPTRGRYEYGATANLIIPAKATPLASPRRKPGSSFLRASGASWIPAFAGMTLRELIPAFTAAITLHPPRPLRGAIMRRREAGWGAVSLRAGSQAGARGGVGLPPGPLRGPARSWLTTVGSIPNAGDRGLSTALGRGEIEPKRDKGSRRDIYGESGAGAGNLRDWRAERRPPLPATEAEP